MGGGVFIVHSDDVVLSNNTISHNQAANDDTDVGSFGAGYPGLGPHLARYPACPQRDLVGTGGRHHRRGIRRSVDQRAAGVEQRRREQGLHPQPDRRLPLLTAADFQRLSDNFTKFADPVRIESNDRPKGRSLI